VPSDVLLTVVDRVKTACSDSRRAKASIIKSAEGCTGAVGGGLANGDSTALIKVDTIRDAGSAGVGATTMDASVGGSIAGAAAVIAGAAVGSATGRVKSRLLSRTVGSAAAALTTAGLGLVFAGVELDPGRDVAPPRWRGTVPGVSGVARVPARPVEEVEVDEVRAGVVVLACGPPGLLIAVSPGGFSGRRSRLGASSVVDNALFADGVSDDVESECRDELDGDDPPDDEPVPESSGAANATVGVLATAIPTPSATASAHMQPMCFAFSMGGYPSLTRAASTGRW
jgi:hypothetical protein